jgi:hypothetical protein
MSATSAPFGLRPVMHQSGVNRPSAYTIATGYASNILQNQPIKIGTNGTIEAAAIGERFIGTFQGVEYTDTLGKRVYAPMWIANVAATDIVAYTTEDPLITYEIQSDAALTVAMIGEQFDFTTISAGSTVTGQSQLMLGVSTTAANASLRLINIAKYPNNAWGDAFVIAQVQISEHQFVADRAAI